VPVVEHLRVEESRMVLFEVASSDAALEYFGIETKGPDNVRRVLQEFSIPADSVGNHVLDVGERRIPLSTVPSDEGSVLVRLVRQPLFIYLIHQLRELWR
jgi:hypothetical protein